MATTGAVALRGDDREARRRGGHRIAVAGPHLQRPRQAVEQPSGLADRHIGMAELAMRRPRQRAAQDLRHELHAVADAEHRHAHLEQRVVAVRRAGLVDAHRPAREDDPGRLPAGDLGGRGAERDDLGIHVQLAEPPRDELGVLRSEVEDQDDLMRHGGGGCGGGVHRWLGVRAGVGTGAAKRVLYRGASGRTHQIWWSVRVAPQALGGRRPVGRPPRRSRRARVRAGVAPPSRSRRPGPVRPRRPRPAPAPRRRSIGGSSPSSRSQAAWTNDIGVSPSAPSATDGVRLYVPASTGVMFVFGLATGRQSLFAALSDEAGAGRGRRPRARDRRHGHRRVEGGRRLAAVEGAAGGAGGVRAGRARGLGVRGADRRGGGRPARRHRRGGLARGDRAAGGGSRRRGRSPLCGGHRRRAAGAVGHGRRRRCGGPRWTATRRRWRPSPATSSSPRAAAGSTPSTPNAARCAGAFASRARRSGWRSTRIASSR